MATSRHDLRKNYEEAEANAIGTECVRADLLPPRDAAKVRALLKDYRDERILFHTMHDPRQLAKVDQDTAGLQRPLWCAARAAATAQPTPVVALAVSGMNDVLHYSAIHAGGMVESLPHCGPGIDGGYRHLLQLADWLGCAQERSALVPNLADHGVYLILSNL